MKQAKYLIKDIKKLDNEISNLENKVDVLELLVEAQDTLLVCYRLGKRPPEKILDKIHECKEWLKGDSDEQLG
jgi:hypothetical protein